MNILYVNKFHYLRGGSEAVYFNTAHLLESKGHRSVFFSMQHPQNLPCETSNYFMPHVDLVTTEGLLSQLKTTLRILYSFEAKKRLSKLLDKYPIDIAHLHNIHYHISPSILHELKKRKIPVIMTLHDYKMACASYLMLANGVPCEACSGGKYFEAVRNKCIKGSFAKSVLAALEMYFHHKVLDIYDQVDYFISPSLFLRNKLIEMGFKKEIIHLPNFIDIKKFKEINKEDVETTQKNSIVYFGRLSEEKGLRTLLETAKKVTTKIVLIGDGPIRSELEAEAKAEGINNIEFLGYMTGKSLYREIKKNSAVILPSEYYENNPISVIEAFAMGIPVIGSRIGGIPELVKDNETGLTFEPGNAEDLREKIETILTDRSSLVQMGKNAQKFVEDELNPEKYYQQLMKIYMRKHPVNIS